ARAWDERTDAIAAVRIGHHCCDAPPVRPLPRRVLLGRRDILQGRDDPHAGPGTGDVSDLARDPLTPRHLEVDHGARREVEHPTLTRAHDMTPTELRERVVAVFHTRVP